MITYPTHSKTMPLDHTYEEAAPYTPSLQGSTGPQPSDQHLLQINTVQLQVIVASLRNTCHNSLSLFGNGSVPFEELYTLTRDLEGLYRAVIGRTSPHVRP